MTIGLLFWILMLIVLIFGIFTRWPAPGTQPWPIGEWVLLWILLALLGWKAFGPALHG